VSQCRSGSSNSGQCGAAATAAGGGGRSSPVPTGLEWGSDPCEG